MAAKEIRSLNRVNESTGNTELFYPATTTDAVADRTRQKSLADILDDLEDNSGAYDISAAHNNATYADLAAALGTNGANVPAAVRKGGMSIKYVQSVDNKYVQYRLTAQTFSTNEDDWTEGGGDGVYDISVANSGATYDNLTAALGSNGANIPSNKRSGGMSIRFQKNVYATYSVVKTEGLDTEPTGTELESDPAINSGTYVASQLSAFTTLPTSTGAANAVTYYVEVSGDTTTYTKWVITKLTNDSVVYVQYRYMSTSTTNADIVNVANWQGIDNIPIAKSKNLIDSGGVYNCILEERKKEQVNLLDEVFHSIEWTENTAMDSYGRNYSYNGKCLSNYIDISQYIGLTFIFRIDCGFNFNTLAFYDKEKVCKLNYSNRKATEITIPDDVVYMRIVKTGDAETPLPDTYNIVTPNYLFGTGYDKYNLADKRRWGTGYNIRYERFDLPGNTRIPVVPSDVFYFFSKRNGGGSIHYKPITIHDSGDNLIQALSFSNGTLNIIKISDYENASFISVNYETFDMLGNYYLWKEGDICNDAYTSNYIERVKGISASNKGVLYDITDLSDSFVDGFYFASSKVENLSDIVVESQSWFYLKLKYNVGILGNLAGSTNEKTVLDSIKSSIKLYVQLDITNIGETNVTFAQVDRTLLRPNIPYTFNFIWPDNNLGIQYVNAGHYSISNVRYYIINTDNGISSANIINSVIIKNINKEPTIASGGLLSTTYDMSVVMFGDSIMESKNAIPACSLIAKRFGMKPVNLAVSGSSPMQNLSDSNLANIPTDAAIVVIAGGTNAPSATLGEIDDKTDRNTIYGCLNYAIDYVLEVNPTCIIVLLCGIQKKGSTTLARWNEAFKTLAEYRQDCICAQPNGLMTNYNLSNYSYDGTHPRTEMSVRYAAAAIHEISKVLC